MKTSIFTVFILFFSFSGMAQDYVHGVGLTGNLIFLGYSYEDPSNSETVTFSTVVPLSGGLYKASLVWDQFALTAYPTLGASGEFNNRTGGSGSFGIALPLNAEYYFGDVDDTAFFVGAGLNTAIAFNTWTGGGLVMGPELALGGQFEFKDQLIGLRLAYTHGLNKGDFDFSEDIDVKHVRRVIGISAYRVFGY